jgi:hypothetical protein
VAEQFFFEKKDFYFQNFLDILSTYFSSHTFEHFLASKLFVPLGSLETFRNIFPEYFLSEFDNKSKFTQTQGFEQKMKISSVDTIF